MTVEGDEFTVAEESHRQDIAVALGIASQALETVEAPTDPRLGDLLALPIAESTRSARVTELETISRRTRIAELQAIPRSTWTTAQMRELIDLMAQELNP